MTGVGVRTHGTDHSTASARGAGVAGRRARRLFRVAAPPGGAGGSGLRVVPVDPIRHMPDVWRTFDFENIHAMQRATSGGAGFEAH